ncbi:MAG: N-acetylmuramoyl-L-alanine amidase [Bacteroidetes bacterium]|nr:MAG: N-acetylmuramoyl-L-alanine amidase [Bacteroidota bacterium]
MPYHQLYCPAEDQPLRLPGQTAAAASRVAESGKPEVAARSEAGPMPKLPMKDSPLRGTYPIFGSKYANVPLDETDLSGKVFYISSGHGGPDPGAVGKFGTQSLCEDEYAYDISLRLAHNLLSRGATVYIIVRDPDDGIREGEILPCDKDENFWLDKDIAVSQSERLFQNSEVINELYRKNLEQGVKDQRLVVIHVDSNSQSEQIDMFFYYKPGDELSKAFAQTVHQTIKQKYEVYRKSRGYEGTVTPRDLHMLRETEPTAVFIELGNIRNRNDQARLVIEGNRQLIANWLLEGILKDVK